MMSLGGGGGAGNDNDGESQDGAPGGGMVIILADQIEGNGFSISARGENAAAAAGDAGSGGGAGGSILLSTNGFGASSLNLDVSGGQGGNAGIAANCLGPGGGGGGGLIRTATALTGNVTSNLTGGASGVINASVTLACAGSPSSATDGQPGADCKCCFGSPKCYSEFMRTFRSASDRRSARRGRSQHPALSKSFR